MRNTPSPPSFDDYAQAALSGLLANPAVMTAVSTQAHVNDNMDQVQATIVNAAIGYARAAIKRRNEILSSATLQ